MIEQILEKIGMTERQAKIYIAGLKLGSGTAAQISVKAHENRITTYKNLQEMCQAGYAKEFVKNKKACFAMIPPDEILEQQKKKVRAMKEAMPELIGLMKNFGEKPKVMVYEGLEEIKKIYFSFLDINDELRIFVGARSKNKDFNNFIKEEYTPKKIEKAFKTRAIVSDSNPFYKDNKFKNNIYKTVPESIFSVTNDIIVYDHNKVVICMYNEEKLSAFVIHSKTVYEFMVGIFELTYKLLEKSNH